MRIGRILVISTLAALCSCGGGSGNSVTSQAVPTVNQYNGTASVGDFLTIGVNASTHTITYSNMTNGEQGTASYTVNANGSYQISDPSGNLISAYEIPGYAMVIQAANAGPNRDASALITAVDAGQITLGTFEGQSYNYMQFRTAAGGLEIGTIAIDQAGELSSSGYNPWMATNNGGQSPISGSQFSLAAATLDSSGTYLTLADQASSDYIFGTSNGRFLVDTPNGAIFGLAKAAAKDFDPSVAGSYQAIYYAKNGASTGAGNIESGTPTLGSATVAVSSGGDVTITDANGSTLASGTLTAVADTSYLYGTAGELADPCYGLFTFRSNSGGVQQDVFVTFLGKSAVFSSFSAAQPSVAGETYDYFYGVGLAQAP
jgi:hypothetical protein